MNKLKNLIVGATVAGTMGLAQDANSQETEENTLIDCPVVNPDMYLDLIERIQIVRFFIEDALSCQPIETGEDQGVRAIYVNTGDAVVAVIRYTIDNNGGQGIGLYNLDQEISISFGNTGGIPVIYSYFEGDEVDYTLHGVQPNFCVINSTVANGNESTTSCTTSVGCSAEISILAENLNGLAIRFDEVYMQYQSPQ